MLKGKTVVVGVTGSIAAYKTASLVSALVKLHGDVHVVMTPNATNFIHPLTFETLTKHKCLIDTFDRNFEYSVEHVSLGQKADIMIIAPASANCIAKLAHGIADDMLTTTALAMRAPIYVSPAMNTAMYENVATQENMEILKKRGIHLIEPNSGYLACGDTGKGKMPEPEELLDYICQEIECEKDLAGKKILVTAGPTRESLDPVRFITNHSSGKMGYQIAKAAARRGAEVTLVSGPTALEAPRFVNTIPVESAKDMADVVFEKQNEMDAFYFAAAVADYTPAHFSNQKMKKKDGEELSLELARTTDILKTLGTGKKPNQTLVGFCMETEDMEERAKEKLKKKNADMIVGNCLNTAGAGFNVDTNVVCIVTKDGSENLPIMSKYELAHLILSKSLL